MRWALALVLLVRCGPGDEVGEVGEVEQGLMICPTQTVEGVDVYQGDGTVDWTQVKGSGRGFAFAKATQGDYNTQANFPANWAGIKAAGMLRGPYHYFDATIDGVVQAQHFLSVVADAGGFEAGDLPAVLDAECPTSPMQMAAGNNCLGNGMNGWAPQATIAQRVFDWLHTVEMATGKKPIIYSYVSWFSDLGVTDSALADYPLFIASPNSCATVPAPWTTLAFWQYSVSGHVPGIGNATANTDVDRFIGDDAQLIAFGLDAGAPQDAGTPSDAGTPPDAGAAHDAGVPDAGAPDAGPSSPPDSGTPPPPDAGMEVVTPHGCGCGASGAAPLLLLTAVGSLRSRRRRAAWG